MNGVKKTKNFFNEFKTFISQGNIIDLAVGVVIGTAFKAIVSSLVADIIMPAVGALFGKSDISSLKYAIKGAGTANEVNIRYGLFIQYIIDFLIIAFCMFIVVKVAIGLRKKIDSISKSQNDAAAAATTVTEAPQTSVEPTNEEKMLSALNDIRDILKKDNNQ